MVNTIKFSEFASGGNLANDELTVGLLGGNNASFNNPWTFLPQGSTLNRPAPSLATNYRLRLNTDTQFYEYYDAVASQWVQLATSASLPGPFVIYEADAGLPDAFNLGGLASGILKQIVSFGASTPAIAVIDVDYYGPGMVGYLQYPAGVKDSNGNIIVQFRTQTAFDVNYLSFFSNQSGSVPQIKTNGGDTNIGLSLVPKGDAGLGINTQAVSAAPLIIYSGTSSQHQTNFRFSNTAAVRTVTFQDASGIVAYLSDVMGAVTSAQGTANQVLVNATSGSQQHGDIILTTPQDIGTSSTPTFASMMIGTTSALLDSNGNLILGLSVAASAVNNLYIENNITGHGPGIFSEGSDTNVNFNLGTQGTGTFNFYTTATSNQFTINTGVASANTHTLNFPSSTNTYTFQSTSGTLAYLSDVAGTVTSAQGTAHQVLINSTSGSPVTGAIILTLPQSIDTTNSPTFSNLQLNGAAILDSNSTTILNFVPTGAGPAVNYVSISNNITGNPGIIAVLGSDTNIGMSLQPKGTGAIGLNTAAPTVPLIIYNGTGSQHQTNFVFSNTSAARNVTFQDASGTLAYLSNIPAGSPSALTETNDTNVTLTLGGTPATALLQAVSLTLGWTGQLGLTRGGTAASLTASNGGIVYSTASALAILSGTSTANQLLLSGASTTPAWSTTTYPSTNAINTIMYASSANVLGVITPANSSVLISSAGGVPSWSTTLPSGIAATNMNLTTPTLGVASATSISFGGSALANYVAAGTFTPAMTFTTAGDLSVVYTTQTGNYTRIGNIVFYNCKLTATPTFTTASGSFEITGLPVTAVTGCMGSMLNLSGVIYPAGTTMVQPQISNSLNSITFYASGTATQGAFLATTNFTTTTIFSITCSGFYYV